MPLLRPLIAVLLLAAPASAPALYIGAKGAVESVEAFNGRNGWAGVLQVGLPMGPYWGVEAEYSATLRRPATEAGTEMDTQMLRGLAVAVVPLGPVQLRLRAGYQYHHWDIGLTSNHGLGPAYGAGLSYRYAPGIAIVADHTRALLDDNAILGERRFQQYSLGVQMAF